MTLFQSMSLWASKPWKLDEESFLGLSKRGFSAGFDMKGILVTKDQAEQIGLGWELTTHGWDEGGSVNSAVQTAW